MIMHALGIMSPMSDDTSRINDTPLKEDTLRNNGTDTSIDSVSLPMGAALRNIGMSVRIH